MTPKQVFWINAAFTLYFTIAMVGNPNILTAFILGINAYITWQYRHHR